MKSHLLIGLKLEFYFSKVFVGLFYLLAESGLVSLQPVGYHAIGQCEHFYGQYRRILCAVDAYRSNRDAWRHLDDTQHGIDAVEYRTLDRYAYHRQCGGCGYHPWQSGSHACTSDDDFQTSCGCTLCKL